MEKSMKNDFCGLENLIKIVVQECDCPFVLALLHPLSFRSMLQDLYAQAG
jgi:hypothetical protein